MLPPKPNAAELGEPVGFGDPGLFDQNAQHERPHTLHQDKHGTPEVATTWQRHESIRPLEAMPAESEAYKTLATQSTAEVHRTYQEQARQLGESLLGAARAILLALTPTGVTHALGLDRRIEDDQAAVRFLEKLAAGGEPRSRAILDRVWDAEVALRALEAQAVARIAQVEVPNQVLALEKREPSPESSGLLDRDPNHFAQELARRLSLLQIQIGLADDQRKQILTTATFRQDSGQQTADQIVDELTPVVTQLMRYQDELDQLEGEVRSFDRFLQSRPQHIPILEQQMTPLLASIEALRLAHHLRESKEPRPAQATSVLAQGVDQLATLLDQ